MTNKVFLIQHIHSELTKRVILIYRENGARIYGRDASSPSNIRLVDVLNARKAPYQYLVTAFFVIGKSDD